MEEAPVEVEELTHAEYSEQDLETLVGYIKQLVVLFDYDEADFNDDVVNVTKTWLQEINEPILFVFYDGDNLSASLDFPLCPINDLTYFMREPEQIFNYLDKFHDDIIFGTLHGDIEGSLLDILENVYGPLLLCNQELSENIISGYNDFLSHLTQIHYKLSGFSLLYIPREGSTMEVQEIVAHRAMVKRLETVIIDWTAQIRSTLNDTQHFVSDDMIRPTDEYEFWIYRCKFKIMHFYLENISFWKYTFT